MVESNRKLAERLTKTPSVYPRQKMAKDWAENESLRRWLCDPPFPHSPLPLLPWKHRPPLYLNMTSGVTMSLNLRANTHATPSSRISQKRPRSILARPRCGMQGENTENTSQEAGRRHSLARL